MKRYQKILTTGVFLSTVFLVMACKPQMPEIESTVENVGSGDVEAAAEALEGTLKGASSLSVIDELKLVTENNAAVKQVIAENQESVRGLTRSIFSDKDAVVQEVTRGTADESILQMEINRAYAEQQEIRSAVSGFREDYLFLTKHGESAASAKQKAGDLQTAKLYKASGRRQMEDLADVNGNDAERFFKSCGCTRGAASPIAAMLFKTALLAFPIGVAGYVTNQGAKIRQNMMQGLSSGSPSPDALIVDPVTANGLLGVDLASMSFKNMSSLQLTSILTINPDDLLLMKKQVVDVNVGGKASHAVVAGNLSTLAEGYCKTMNVVDLRAKLLLHLHSTLAHFQQFAKFVSTDIHQTLTAKAPFPTFFSNMTLVSREYNIFNENTRTRGDAVEVVVYPGLQNEKVIGTASNCSDLNDLIVSNRANIESSRL